MMESIEDTMDAALGIGEENVDVGDPGEEAAWLAKQLALPELKATQASTAGASNLAPRASSPGRAGGASPRSAAAMYSAENMGGHVTSEEEEDSEKPNKIPDLGNTHIKKNGKVAKAHIKKKEVKEQLHAQHDDIHFIEDERMRMEYTDTVDEFSDMVTQFGYLALFAPAYALAPICALLNNILEIRIDAAKFCNVYRRPQWRSCADIGSWYMVLNIIGFIAVGTNCSMITFVGTQLSQDKRCSCDSAQAQVGESLAETMSADIAQRSTRDGTDPDEQLVSYFGASTCTLSCWEQEGIWNRVQVQRLWTILLLLEHAVLICRMVINKLEPEVPDWLRHSRITLNHRVKQWQKAVKYMRKTGLTTDEIQHKMWKDEEEARLAEEERQEMQQDQQKGVESHIAFENPIDDDATFEADDSASASYSSTSIEVE
jgi:hypothetical protein